MKSKKKLFAEIKEEFGIGLSLKSSIVSDETYGRKSMIYTDWGTPEKRQDAERRLILRGFKVHRSYWKGSPVSEIQVSYFKGYHWDE